MIKKDIDEWRVENIKETAMNRFNVKKSRRKYIKRILDDAFDQLKSLKEKE
jgi:hypothetical protein